MNFKLQLKTWQNLVEEELSNLYTKEVLPQKTVYDAMKYSLNAGGKRLRPILVLAVGDLFSLSDTTLLPYACALEMIHTYSLIHDDLPAMDNDDLRRGKPTNHKVFGEAIAILAGDGLLNSAFETMLEAATKSSDANRALVAMKIIADAAGVNGMIGGQVVDMESENKSISEDLLKYMHHNKTGALIKAAVLAPAILAGAKDEEMNALNRYSENIGIAFQIKDDVLDVEGNNDILGKPVGSDAQNGKTTFVTLHGLDESKRILKELTKEAVASLQVFGEKGLFLKDLALYLLDREK